MNMGGNFGGALAAFLSAWIAQEVGWAGAFTVGSVLAFLGSILWMTIDSTYRVPRREGDRCLAPSLNSQSSAAPPE
jgi:MFS family permease